MTKKIRIENADNSNHKVRVYTEWLVDGQWVRSNEQLPAKTTDLVYPADLAELWVYGTQRLVVEETSE
jgi:hypothetical protein